MVAYLAGRRVLQMPLSDTRNRAGELFDGVNGMYVVR